MIAAAERSAMTLLLVDDDEISRRFTAMILSKMGYTVLVAAGADEALRLGDEHAGRIDLLISDVVMPRLDGFELADQLAPRHPGLRMIFMSGYPEDLLRRKMSTLPDAEFIEKPFITAMFLERIRRAIEDAVARRNV